MRMRLQRILWLTLLLLTAASVQAGNSKFTDSRATLDLRSASAIVVDSDGNLIYGKDVDTVRPIASITKLMTAMVILDARLDLDEKITITKDDRDLIRLTGSRLEYGASLTRRELLLLSLMSSENRAATALGRTYPGGMNAFVSAMNGKADQLGMGSTEFADPAGLKSQNVSTAKDLARMLDAAGHYPLITQATTTTRKEVHPYSPAGPAHLRQYQSPAQERKLEHRTQQNRVHQRSGTLSRHAGQYRGGGCLHRFAQFLRQADPFGDSNRLRKWMLANS